MGRLLWRVLGIEAALLAREIEKEKGECRGRSGRGSGRRSGRARGVYVGHF